MNEPWVARLGWTLVHFLWQGSAIAALYAIARAFTGRRYALACVALTAMLAAPIATYSVRSAPESTVPTRSPIATASTATSESGTTFAVTAAENAVVASTTERVLPLIVMLWFTGALFFSVRLTGGWIAASRLTRVVSAAPREWQQTLARLKARMRVTRPVRLVVSALVETPAVIGWLRPAILVPVNALAGLPAGHLEALLLHELAHIRRHDYLVNALQSVAEALLFYHPAVWWISGHVRTERELCCDDLAVAATGDAFTYATALADLEALRHSPMLVAANGGRLRDRIARVLGQTQPQLRTSYTPAGVSAILVAISATLMFAQTADIPKFEVASVRPTPEKEVKYSDLRPLPGGRLIAKNMTVRGLITTAYRLQGFQVSGGPEWIHNVGFDIEAKGDANADRAKMLTMLQPLLEDRFQLKFHRETRELPVFALSVARGGAKLPASKQGRCVNLDDNPGPPAPGAIPCGTLSVQASPSGMRVQGGQVSMQALIRSLASMLGRPVLDRTGVDTRFDVDLTFTVDEMMAGMMKNAGSVAGHSETMALATASPTDEKALPGILTALREQLGLKLESTKGPVEVMVIDRVERPSEN